MLEAVLGIVAAFAPLIAALVKAWLDDRPARRVEETRRENRQIAVDVDGDGDGDGDALGRVNRRLRQWMAEDD